MGQFDLERPFRFKLGFRVGAEDRLFIGLRDGQLDLLPDLGQIGFAPALFQQPLFKDGNRIARLAAPRNVVGAAVDRMVVRIRVAAEAFHLEHDQRRSAVLTHVGHDFAKCVVSLDRLATIHEANRHAEKLVVGPVGQRIESPPCGGRGNGVVIVLDHKQHGQPAANRFGTSFQKLALLRRPIPRSTIDNRRSGLVADGGCDPRRLQSIVAHGDDHAEHVEVRIAKKPVHLPAARA